MASSSSSSRVLIDDNETPSVLEEDTSRSLAATLKLAKAKGYVEKEAEKRHKLQLESSSSFISSAKGNIHSNKRAKLEAAKVYVVEEKGDEHRRGRGDGNKHSYRGNNRTTSGGNLREVKEPEDYKPEIILKYTDDAGRKLDTPKEAFRYMCYKFHGKGPGKNKIDKRLRRQEIERKMKQ